MTLLVFFLIGVFVALGTGALAAVSDLKSLTIPNIYSVLVCGAFLVTYVSMVFFGHDDLFFPFLSHLLGALIVFIVTLVMFAFGLLGAADSKLATAFALWVGLKGLFVFLFYMTLFGGILGVCALLLRRFKPFKSPAEGTWISVAQSGGNKVPYGVAIFLGALISFLTLGFFDYEHLASFLL